MKNNMVIDLKRSGESYRNGKLKRGISNMKPMGSKSASRLFSTLCKLIISPFLILAKVLLGLR